MGHSSELTETAPDPEAALSCVCHADVPARAQMESQMQSVLGCPGDASSPLFAGYFSIPCSGQVLSLCRPLPA